MVSVIYDLSENEREILIEYFKKINISLINSY